MAHPARPSSTKEILEFDIRSEVNRLFDDSSIPADGQPAAVILMGGPATGKTTVRKQKYSSGYVLIDAADIFLSLSRGEPLPFPGPLEEPMDLIGRFVTQRALSLRRNIVTEIIGSDENSTRQLMEALTRIGYKIEVAVITCDVQEALRRNASRANEDILAYYAEPFQRDWILGACNEMANA